MAKKTTTTPETAASFIKEDPKAFKEQFRGLPAITRDMTVTQRRMRELYELELQLADIQARIFALEMWRRRALEAGGHYEPGKYRKSMKECKRRTLKYKGLLEAEIGKDKVEEMRQRVKPKIYYRFSWEAVVNPGGEDI